MKNYLLGCDWGTSSFRLRLIRIADRQLVGEIVSPDGIASTFTAWKKQGEPVGISREQFFRQHLKRQVNRLAGTVGFSVDHACLVISGMASSSIGMAEVPYSTLPFPVDGSQASLKRLAEQPNFPHEILLISGVRSEHDVMRGEETQLIGLLALLKVEATLPTNAILIFPGTHSKHIYVQDEQLIDFKTFMTGEVFNLMANDSILKDSVEISLTNRFTKSDLDAFKSGVNEVESDALLASLFGVRTNQLFNKLTKRQNALYLSGLLIGSELKTLTGKPDWPLILCSGTNLFELYSIAMQTLDLSRRTTTISAHLLDQATMAGQVKIMQNQLVAVNK